MSGVKKNVFSAVLKLSKDGELPTEHGNRFHAAGFDQMCWFVLSLDWCILFMHFADFLSIYLRQPMPADFDSYRASNIMLCMQSAICFYQFCPSIRLFHCIWTNVYIAGLFPTSDGGFTIVFWALLSLHNFEPCQLGALNTLQIGKFAIFGQSRRLCRKRYEIGPQLLWITNKKS